MNISGMDKARVLMTLYNGSKQQGFGLYNLHGKKAMTLDEAQYIIDNYGMNYEYLNGRIMKIDISGDEVHTSAYNRDVGEGAAERLIEELKKSL